MLNQLSHLGTPLVCHILVLIKVKVSVSCYYLENHYFLSHLFLFFSFLFFKFVYFERETAWSGEGHRERETEDPKQALCCQQRTRHGAPTHETVRSWPEWKPRVGRLTDWATQAHPLPAISFRVFSLSFLSVVPTGKSALLLLRGRSQYHSLWAHCILAKCRRQEWSV